MPATAAEKLFERLAKGKAPAVVLLLGSDPYWRDLCRRKKLNNPVRHQSDHDKRAHDPAGPQGTMEVHRFRHPMVVRRFRHLVFSNGVVPCPGAYCVLMTR